jgi:uncharacterized cupredoxin-like copper-binding protein
MPTPPRARRLLSSCLIGLLTTVPSYAADPSFATSEWDHAQPITVVMVDNRFEPDHLTFRQGQPYELRLENHGKEMHEFTAPEFFRATTLRDKTLLANAGTDVVVQAGQSATIFLQPRAKGDYKLICADHDWDGMVGTITVD